MLQHQFALWDCSLGFCFRYDINDVVMKVPRTNDLQLHDSSIIAKCSFMQSSDEIIVNHPMVKNETTLVYSPFADRRCNGLCAFSIWPTNFGAFRLSRRWTYRGCWFGCSINSWRNIQQVIRNHDFDQAAKMRLYRTIERDMLRQWKALVEWAGFDCLIDIW